MSAVADWLLKAKNVLAGSFGVRWSSQWVQAEFISPSIAIPSNAGEQLALCLRLAAFFTAQPTYQVVDLKVTASEATALRNAAVDSQAVLATATVTLNNIGITWTAAYDALTKDMVNLVRILTATLSKSDPRWTAFGLNIPSSNTTPGQPQNLTAMVHGDGSILLQCDRPSLAMRFRWRMLRVGIETDYSLVASSADPMATVNGVLAGQTVRFVVQAVNGGSQGVASEPVQCTVPFAPGKAAMETKAPAATLSLDEVPMHFANGNGSRNGHMPVVARL